MILGHLALVAAAPFGKAHWGTECARPPSTWISPSSRHGSPSTIAPRCRQRSYARAALMQASKPANDRLKAATRELADAASRAPIERRCGLRGGRTALGVVATALFLWAMVRDGQRDISDKTARQDRAKMAAGHCFA